MHERGEAVRASVILAEGLKREPDHVEALEWLLHLYVEELPNPGMEREILQILRVQHNARELYDIVRAELRDLGQGPKLAALEQVVERDGLMVDDEPADEAPHGHAEGDEEAPSPQAVAQAQEPNEDWGSFDNPLGRADDAGPSPEADLSSSQPTRIRADSAPPVLAPPAIDAAESVAAVAATVSAPADKRVSKSTTSRRVVPDRTLLVIGVVALFIGLAIVAFAIFSDRNSAETTYPAGSQTTEGSAEFENEGVEGSAEPESESPESETTPEEP